MHVYACMCVYMCVCVCVCMCLCVLYVCMYKCVHANKILTFRVWQRAHKSSVQQKHVFELKVLFERVGLCVQQQVCEEKEVATLMVGVAMGMVSDRGDERCVCVYVYNKKE